MPIRHPPKPATCEFGFLRMRVSATMRGPIPTGFIRSLPISCRTPSNFLRRIARWRWRSSENSSNVRISVRDHGPGIAADFKRHIFERFAQADVDDARLRGGTGLGLSIVKEIVERLDGEVSFADVPGGGTVFHVDLPCWMMSQRCHRYGCASGRFKTDPSRIRLQNAGGQREQKSQAQARLSVRLLVWRPAVE